MGLETKGANNSYQIVSEEVADYYKELSILQASAWLYFFFWLRDLARLAVYLAL